MVVLPCGLLVENKTFSKTCVVKSLTVYTGNGGCETKSACFNETKRIGNAELMLVILNCSLLHNQNDRWTVL
jgi:hypothetical protein